MGLILFLHGLIGVLAIFPPLLPPKYLVLLQREMLYLCEYVCIYLTFNYSP